MRCALAVQMDTPGVLEFTLQSCTAPSMHGQLESVVFCFQTHWPEAAWHLPLNESAQSGTFAAWVQKELVVQERPPQLAPTMTPFEAH